MKKIYITGIAGMLGSNIAYCLRENYEIYGCDTIQVHMPGISTTDSSVLDETKMRHELTKIAPEVLIHTVAAVNVDLCEKNPAFAQQMNTESTDIMSRICSDIGIKMIYISTDAVFEPEQNILSREDDKKNPQNEYARTKLTGEPIVLKNSKNLVLRTNIYGYNIQHKRSFGEWVLSALQQDQTLSMFDDIYFSPILVNELAMVISMCIEEDLCGLYHACATGAVNKYDFGVMLKQEFHIQTGEITRSNSSQFPFAARRSKHMGMSNEKICKALHIKLRTPKESIQEFKRLYEEGYPVKLKQFGGINHGI